MPELARTFDLLLSAVELALKKSCQYADRWVIQKILEFKHLRIIRIDRCVYCYQSERVCTAIDQAVVNANLPSGDDRFTDVAQRGFNSRQPELSL